MKLTDLPHSVLDVIGHNVAAGQHPQHVMRDLLNLRRTAKPFEDIRARAEQPTHFKHTSAALQTARDALKANVERAQRETDPLAFAQQFASMSLGEQNAYVKRSMR